MCSFIFTLFKYPAMNRSQHLLLVALLLVSSIGCIPPSGEVNTSIDIDWSKEDIQQIIDAGDERREDVLSTYLAEPDATKRYLSTQVYGSILDHNVHDQLNNILTTDPSEACRQNAAFALGQSTQPEVSRDMLVAAFGYQDSVDINNESRMRILEAVGKVGDEKMLRFIADQSTYLKTHDYLLLGQAKSLYHFGLRGMTDPKGTEKMLGFLLDQEISVNVRVIAANYFNRFRNIDLTLLDEQLFQAYKVSDDPRIKMCLLPAIARGGDPQLLQPILGEIAKATDYRTKVNGIRGLASYPYDALRDRILDYLSDDNIHVAITTAELIKNTLSANATKPIIRLCQEDLRPEVKARLYAGVLRAVPYYLSNTRKRAADEVQIGMSKLSSPYRIANYIEALSYDPLNYEILYQKGIKSKYLPVVSAAIGAIPNILKADKFDQIYKTKSAVEKVRSDVLKYLLDVYRTDNTGAIAIASVVLRDEDLGFKDEIESLEPLLTASRSLKIPEHLETKIEIEKTIAYLKNESYEDIRVDYNHPIDWTAIEALTDSSIVYILTDRGNIELKLYPNEAAGTVSNFVKLIELDFYDGKVFHRVVPNFVVQTGCPRGDGYGSLDYNIRSEFSTISYDDGGYIGMASAGPDTESTQWFITHSPTPHLDGRYTIFGKVISGMEVVHEIQQGDKITDIRIIK